MSSDSDCSVMESTPPELRAAAAQLANNLLPVNSKSRYEKAYFSYKNWCVQKGAKNITSENVVLAYFSELGEHKKPSTLWSSYSMLKSTLNIKHQIDISKFAKLIAYLKRKNVGYVPKKSRVFTRQNIVDFLNNTANDFLAQKVALIIGVSGACRSDELFKLKISDISISDKIIVTIPDTKTYQSRAFVIMNPNWIDHVKQYVELRKSVKNERFFFQVRFGKVVNQPYGHNSIAKFPQVIATYLQLEDPKAFTGHCFRRTAATLLANSGGDVLQLKKLGGWKSSTVAEGYVDNSLEGQVKIAGMLSTNNETPIPSTSYSNMCPSTSITPNHINFENTEENDAVNPVTMPSNTKSPKKTVSYASNQEFQFSNQKLQQGLSLNIRGYDNATFNFHFHYSNATNDNDNN